MTNLYLDKKYISLLSSKLRNYKIKQQNPFVANLSCPLCGDSKTNKHKARGYVLEKGGSLLFYCHNCNASFSILNLIKKIDHFLYNEYVKEKFSVDNKKDLTEESINITRQKAKTTLVFDKHNFLKRISKLPDNNLAKQYVLQRKIPIEFLSKLFYVEKFKEFVNSIIPNKFGSLYNDSPRIVIPFLNKEGKLFGFQGRSFLSENRKENLRYISIVLDDKYSKIYGLNSVDLNKVVYVLEGAFDSMFVDNSVATCDANYLKAEELLPDCDKIYIPDKDRRNKEILSNIEKLIKHDCKVCLLPNYLQGKDINQMIINGNTKKEIKEIIDKNVFQGLQLQLKFNEWKRI